MKIAIYGQFSNHDTLDVLREVIQLSVSLNFEITVENELYQNTQELHIYLRLFMHELHIYLGLNMH